MSADRDYLTELLDRYDDYWSSNVADKILEAGYRRPRTITTPEDLAALPVGAVVIDDDLEVCKKVDDATWFIACGDGHSFDDSDIEIPAVVLHEPTF